MSWVKIDDRYATHRKILRAGPTAMALDVAGMCYAAQHGTDGHVPIEALGAAAPFLTPAKAVAAAGKLVEVGRWTVVADGWQIHDFLAYNPTAADRAQRQQSTVDRVRRHRQKKREGNALSPLQRNATPGPIPAPPKAGMGPPKAPHPQPPSGPASPSSATPGGDADSAGQSPTPPGLTSTDADPGDQPKRLAPALNGALPPFVAAELDAVLGANWRSRIPTETSENRDEFEAKREQKLNEFESKFAQELNENRTEPEGGNGVT